MPGGEIDAFVRRHFLWPGSLRLHRAALGLDLLRAPLNVLLSPLLVAARLLGWICGALRLARLSRWLKSRRLLLRTAVAARVETLILTELLDVPLPGPARPHASLQQAILTTPALRAPIRRCGSVAAAERMAGRIIAALGEYSGARAAMAEFTTALIMLMIGAMAFHAVTPGAISMVPGVAAQVAKSTAIAHFPFGAGPGALWYGLFPVGPSPGLVAATLICLVILGAIVATFAGVLADPVQVWLGVHRRRLIRLMAVVEAERDRAPEKTFVAREHFLARIFDLWDAVLWILRVLRG
ncbi:hypothetical protein SAMN05877831_101193 [Rhodobacter maris]|uniref:Uncharacterized protein n=1 Tax=Rhodobacter maris TaxID=446682 RepID=A0A285RIJ9_9RHOB|nr:hypothetical protein SAMN05877831_101193 [Rhodobacter maris]